MKIIFSLFVAQIIYSSIILKSFPIASETDFQEYLATEENKGCEPKFFNQERHCGATFAPTDAFIKVGGYCESFTSWGCRDADVQWKLESIIGMDLIPYISSFEVIHLDHPKGYFDKEDWNENREGENYG